MTLPADYFDGLGVALRDKAKLRPVEARLVSIRPEGAADLESQDEVPSEMTSPPTRAEVKASGILRPLDTNPVLFFWVAFMGQRTMAE